jgi:hypothetical protein
VSALTESQQAARRMAKLLTGDDGQPHAHQSQSKASVFIGGAFITGLKDWPDAVNLCDELASLMGYPDEGDDSPVPERPTP